jgi:hypothetical protein
MDSNKPKQEQQRRSIVEGMARTGSISIIIDIQSLRKRKIMIMIYIEILVR